MAAGKKRSRRGRTGTSTSTFEGGLNKCRFQHLGPLDGLGASWRVAEEES